MAERPLFDTSKSKEQPERKISPVVSKPAKTKKKSEVHKLRDIFLAEDLGNVKSYVIWDVVVPEIKKTISEVVRNGIDIILYGESGRGKSRTGASKVSYGGFYKDRDSRRDPREASTRLRSGLDYDDIIFETRGEAEAVLSAMDDVIDQYGVVSIGDLYDMAQVSTTNYAINKYGWKDIRAAQVVRVRDGFMIKLPRAIPLD